MSLRVRLFGRLAIERNGAGMDGFGAGKVQELFCYLLVKRDRSHSREHLATVLWGDTTTSQSKKYLRQVLWQLQLALRGLVDPDAKPTLEVDAESVQFTSNPAIWVDLGAFESAIAPARGVPIERLDAGVVRGLETAVGLYRADLLDGWYQEWCRDERERWQMEYVAALDKLIAHSEVKREYEAGLRYGALSLRCDRARECTHQRLMRIYYLAGDRAAALRQFDRCTIALDQELDVTPSAITIDLYEQIRAGTLLATAAPGETAGGHDSPLLLHDVLSRLRTLEESVADLHGRLESTIQEVERSLDSQGVTPESRATPPAARLPDRFPARRNSTTRRPRIAALDNSPTRMLGPR